MNEHVYSGKSKLASAMQEAALANINEDIKGIYDSIEKIINEFPTEINSHTLELKTEIESLHLALKSVPETFDADFSKKMNKILDVLLEVDLHSTKLNKTLQNDNSEFLTKTASQYASEFNSRTEDYQRIRFWEFLLYGFVTVTLGGLISGLFMWVVFPKIF